MYGRHWIGALLFLLSSCSDPLGVVVDLDGWPDGAVSLRVEGTLDGTPSLMPLVFPAGTTRFVAYVPQGESGELALKLTALDGNGCPRASAGAQLAIPRGLWRITETAVTLSPSTPPYCPGPVLDGGTPGLAPTFGGIAFSLSGQHILPEPTVTVDGILVTDLTMTSPTTLTGTLPAKPGAFGPVPVVLRNPDGQTASRSDLFAYYSSQLSFSSMRSFGTDKSPRGVAAGDWNGDRKLDLAVANGQSSVSVLLGDGQGGFGSTNVIAIGANVTSVAAGDFNGDKHPDLAIISYGSNSAKLLLGDGAGGFLPGDVILTQLGNPGKVTVADVNGDSLLDLVVPCAVPASVNVLLGNGVGGFSSSGAFTVGMSPYGAAVGDFNGDHKMDLAVTSIASGSVSILLGNGQGLFSPAPTPTVSAGNTPSSIVAGDVNGDMKVDLVFVNTNDSTVSVLLGDGQGGFGAAKNFGAGNTPYEVVLADIDGDRQLDLAIASGDDNTVRVLRGDGKGSFGTAAVVGTDTNPRSVAVADFNGDGKPDLVTGNYTGNNVSVLINQSQ
jgi:hypothetical protein